MGDDVGVLLIIPENIRILDCVSRVHIGHTGDIPHLVIIHVATKTAHSTHATHLIHPSAKQISISAIIAPLPSQLLPCGASGAASKEIVAPTSTQAHAHHLLHAPNLAPADAKDALAAATAEWGLALPLNIRVPKEIIRCVLRRLMKALRRLILDQT